MTALINAEAYYALFGGCVASGLLVGVVVAIVNSWRV